MAKLKSRQMLEDAFLSGDTSNLLGYKETKKFEVAREAYISGDSRKLAEFVRTNTMTPEQSEFVAQALSGDIETEDGRSVTRWTQNLYFDYLEIQTKGQLREILFGDKVRVTKAEIYRKLAEHHGYNDEGTVKKAIVREEQRRKGLPVDYAGLFKRTFSQGRVIYFPEFPSGMSPEKLLAVTAFMDAIFSTDRPTLRTFGGAAKNGDTIKK